MKYLQAALLFTAWLLLSAWQVTVPTVPINQAPAQTGPYNAQSQRIQNLGQAQVLGDALGWGQAALVTNLTANGAISITGNQTNGTDSISHVNLNGVIDPRTYGAKCDGTTDDTNAITSAATAAIGGVLAIPPNHKCLMTSWTLNSLHDLIIDGGNTSGGQYGALVITAPDTAACSTSAGGGIKLTAPSAAKLTFRNIDLLWKAGGSNPDCFINVAGAPDGAYQATFDHVEFGVSGSPTGKLPIAVFIANNNYFSVGDGSLFDGGAFRQAIYEPSAATYDNVIQIGGGVQPTVFGSSLNNPNDLPWIEFDGNGQDLKLSHLNFEVGDAILLYGGEHDVAGIDHIWTGDKGSCFAWAASHSYGSGVNTCVTPTDYRTNTGHEYSFFNFGTSCTSGTTEPTWGTNPAGGATVTDGSCTWTKEGRGQSIRINTNFTAGLTIKSNVLNAGTDGIRIAAWSAQTNNGFTYTSGNISGNYVDTPGVDNIWIDQSNWTATRNRLDSAIAGVYRIHVGDGTTVLYNLVIGPNTFTGSNVDTQAIVAEAHTVGTVVYSPAVDVSVNGYSFTGLGPWNKVIDAQDGSAGGEVSTPFLQATTGVLQGSGLKHQRISSCTTGTTANSTCATTLTWTTAFLDANYTAICGLTGATNNPSIEYETKLAGSLAVVITNGPLGGAAAATIECAALHD